MLRRLRRSCLRALWGWVAISLDLDRPRPADPSPTRPAREIRRRP